MKFLLMMPVLIAALSCASPKTVTAVETAAMPSSEQGKTYPVAVFFNSICCGTPSEVFLKDYVKNFNKNNAVKVTADIAAGCGREGEFTVLFDLSSIPVSKKAVAGKFMSGLKKLVTETDAKNKQTNTSSGGIEVVENVKSTDYGNCRMGIKPWSFK